MLLGAPTFYSPTLPWSSGMETRILKVDRKGRMHIPKEIRDKLGIKTRVKGSVKGGVLVIEPISNLLDKLAGQVRFNFNGIEESLPGLRITAEEQLLKEIA